jgi:hypothetical protein
MLIGKVIRAFKVFTVRNRNGYWCLIINPGDGWQKEVYSEGDPIELIGKTVEIEYSLRLPMKIQDRWKFIFIDSIKILDKLS